MSPVHSRQRKKRKFETSPGCEPLRVMYASVTAARVSRWVDVEADFLAAMWDFDQNVRTGKADQGDIQNGKGDFFNDVITHLLENCSGHALYSRTRVPGLIFPAHALDATYPLTGDVEVMVETKAAGAPKTRRNPSQRNPLGRPGSADLDKRVKEAALKTIDLKLQWARREGKGGGPAGDLVSWLRNNKPLSFMFLAVRVVDETDLRRALQQANAANLMMDGVGVYAYRPDRRNKAYEACKIALHLELDRVLTRVCTALKSLP